MVPKSNWIVVEPPTEPNWAKSVFVVVDALPGPVLPGAGVQFPGVLHALSAAAFHVYVVCAGAGVTAAGALASKPRTHWTTAGRIEARIAPPHAKRRHVGIWYGGRCDFRSTQKPALVLPPRKVRSTNPRPAVRLS